MTNAELAEFGLTSTTNSPIMLPVPERVKAGKGYKTVQNFAGNGSASAIRAALKAKGMKGSKLNEMVQETLRGDKSLREQLAAAYLQERIQSGCVPSHGEQNKMTSKIVLLNPVAEKYKAPALENVEPDYASMSADQIADLLHKLEAILDKKVEEVEGK